MVAEFNKGDICIYSGGSITKSDSGFEYHNLCEVRIIREDRRCRKIGRHYRVYNITLDRYETVDGNSLTFTEQTKRKHKIEKILSEE